MNMKLKYNRVLNGLIVTMSCMLMVFGMILPVHAASTLGTVRIYSTLEDSHAFLLYTNNSGTTQTIGHYTVASGSTISIGTWGSITQHKGIWYNVEMRSDIGVASNVSVARSITSQTQLSNFNNAINRSDSWNLYTGNTCAYFAGYVWCQTFSEKVNVGMSPSLLASTIKKLSGYGSNVSFGSHPNSWTAYHTSSSITYCPNPTFSNGSSSLSRSGLIPMDSFTPEEHAYLEVQMKPYSNEYVD